MIFVLLLETGFIEPESSYTVSGFNDNLIVLAACLPKMKTTPPTRPASCVEAGLALVSSKNRQGGPGLALSDEAPFPSVDLLVMQAG